MLSRDMTALLDNVHILAITKKRVNKLHSVGLVTSLWLGVTQRITNEISNFATWSNKATPSHTLVSGHSQAYKWMRAGG